MIINHTHLKVLSHKMQLVLCSRVHEHVRTVQDHRVAVNVIDSVAILMLRLVRFLEKFFEFFRKI